MSIVTLEYTESAAAGTRILLYLNDAEGAVTWDGKGASAREALLDLTHNLAVYGVGDLFSIQDRAKVQHTPLASEKLQVLEEVRI